MRVAVTFDQAAAMSGAVARAVRAYGARVGCSGDAAAAQLLGALIGAVVASKGPDVARRYCTRIINTLERHAERGEVADDVLELELAEGEA